MCAISEVAYGKFCANAINTKTYYMCIYYNGIIHQKKFLRKT